MAGVDSKACERAELGVSPLRYRAAWYFLAWSRKSAEWLATGRGHPDHFITLPEPNEIGAKANLRFSAVWDDFASARSNPHYDPQMAWKRFFLLNSLIAYANVWYAKVADSHLDGLDHAIREAVKAFESTCPEVSWEKILQQVAAVERQQTEYDKKKSLTEASSVSSVRDVKLEGLLRRANELTEKSGKKSELAKSMSAPLASVSRWLAGRRKPSADKLLRLLQWVEQQEAKQKT
jgi:DNA-binding transcriptional regulator YiaG